MPKIKKIRQEDYEEHRVQEKKPKKQATLAKDWVFTWNNPTDDDILSIEQWPYNFIVFQKEVGENGTPHLQGFVQFTNQTRITALKKLNKRVHWEKRKGTPYEAVHYCEKPKEGCDCKHCVAARLLPPPSYQFKDGCLSVSGSIRADEIARSIKESSLSKTIDRYPTAALSMSRGMEYLDNHYTTPRGETTKCTVLYGFPGTGKTTYARKGPSPYVLPVSGGKDQTEFWGSYKPREHRTIVVDEFYGNWTFTNFKRYVDEHPCEVHVKNGFKQLNAEHIVFTSNAAPSTWYRHVCADPINKAAFERRIHNIIEFFEDGSYQIHKGGLPWPGLEHKRQRNIFDVLLVPPAPVQEPEDFTGFHMWKEIEDMKSNIRAQAEREIARLTAEIKARPKVLIGASDPPFCDA